MNHKYSLDMVQIRMVPDRTCYSKVEVNAPEIAVDLLVNELKGLDRECFVVLNLNTHAVPINANIVSTGSLQSAALYPREVYKSAILSNAASVIVMHNHPSGFLKPSSEDIDATNRLLQCGRILGIPLQDHIIFNEKGERLSLREENLMDPYRIVDAEEINNTLEKIEKQEREKARRSADFEDIVVQTPEQGAESSFSISREVDGKPVEIALSKEELLEAYFLQRRENAIEYVEDKLEDVEVYNADNLLYGMPLDEIFEHRDLIERLADAMEEIADQSGMPDWDALDLAYAQVIPEYVKELEAASAEELASKISSLSEEEMRDMLLHMKYNDQRKIMDDYFGEADADEKEDASTLQSRQFDYDLE